MQLPNRTASASPLSILTTRALELLDLTISDEKNQRRLRELLRVREALADCYFFDNIYCSSDESWQRYFYPFQFAARANR